MIVIHPKVQTANFAMKLLFQAHLYRPPTELREGNVLVVCGCLSMGAPESG